MGRHRSEEAFKYLITRVGYNVEPMRARPVAIDGLASSAEWRTDRLKNEAVEVLGTFRLPWVQRKSFELTLLIFR